MVHADRTAKKQRGKPFAAYTIFIVPGHFETMARSNKSMPR
jgi:hypothetical protein